MENVGPLLRSFRVGGNFMSAGIGRENGELIVSDTESDKEKISHYSYGKAHNYDVRTRDWYIEAKKQNGIYISPAYEDTLTTYHALPLHIRFTKMANYRHTFTRSYARAATRPF